MNSFKNFFHLQDMSWPTILLRLRDTSYGHWLMKETCLLLSNWLVDLLLVLWPKQVINISGTSIVPVRIISINTEASATKDRVDSCFTEPSDSHTEGAFHLSELAELDQSVSKRNGLFPEGLLKNHLLRAYYLWFDWSGWIVLIKSQILITTGMVWPVSSGKWKAPRVSL